MTRTALVLGGGGITGIAWELGMLLGLQRAGLDLTGADLVVGTSAGSVVGAQVTGARTLEDLYAGQLEPPDHEIGARVTRSFGLRMALPMLTPGSEQTRLRRLGRASLRAHEPGGERRVEVIRSRIGIGGWAPDRDLRITAVEATTGTFTVFGKDSGVDLVHAVAASCAVPLVWPAVTIDGRHYVDGGMRSGTNADLASGADVIVVLAPLPRAYHKDASIRAQLARTGCLRTAVLSPDEQALLEIGPNVLDPGQRAVAARTGLRQAQDAVSRVRDVWPDPGRPDPGH